MTSSEAFDSLCQRVFMTSTDSTSPASDSTPPEETALSLIIRAQVYELPQSLANSPAPTVAPSLSSQNNQDRLYYRIHLEILDATLQGKVRQILVDTIDPSSLIELPFDRNLTGYSSKTRTETRQAPLESSVVLDMDGLTTTTSSEETAEAQSLPSTMLLLPTKEWLQLTGRIRYWRAESHRVKAAQREIVLDNLLKERWIDPSSHQLAAISASPPSSGSFIAANIPQASLPSSPSPSASSSSATSVPSSSPISSLRFQSSPYKHTFQEHQSNILVQFMTQYGEEPSVTSLLRGLLDLIRRQLTLDRVLIWTFDRANLTEQKPEATVAFLDLLACLGMELVERPDEATPAVVPEIAGTNSIVSATSETTVVGSSSGAGTGVSGSNNTKKDDLSTELMWTFGAKIDDRRLEYWVHNIQQATLPSPKLDGLSLLPSSVTVVNNNDSTASKSGLNQTEHHPNPIPIVVRKRFLQDRNTIPAGRIQVLTTAHNNSHNKPMVTPPPQQQGGREGEEEASVMRDNSLVLSSSKYALDSAGSQSLISSPGMFVERVRKDIKHLARWATTCGGRLDWIWAWLFSSIQRSRHRSTTEPRPPRSNDENV
ncbi:hypothetical protein BX616_005802 [Lobosporangium transversale]|uniref:Uncharacterized protein n=1 Tax=Lobosporangium transversale TaxID=64571 RepID=A0A1Y2GQ71_9FUNG|nr:hypothetical protein BCR41DRAFT_46219 [Lobosporangium transversale]KAF9897322.1 hypothetical protein BX616_005802 [Lobosporangium transversale]ORZ18367.1 hypothetical protein BCR41DRAFT_46219 [Lobosporangium transversale]|eukprot:XP_021882162.1 hypothetical protein BCR41DRAFT_46219 [Lobosporangium transversale]